MIIRLDCADGIMPIRTLNKTIMSHWRFASDYADIGGAPANTLR
jgi:hypothetical protein